MSEKEKNILIKILSDNPNLIEEAVNIAELNGDNETLKKIKEISKNVELTPTNVKRNLILPLKIRNEIFGLKTILGKKMIFYGSPGTGKSATAKMLGDKYKLYSREINSYDVISSNLGESLYKLKTLIFNDEKIDELIIINEIDGLINKRDADNESHEIHRLTSGMMNIFDNLPMTKSVVFTTNFIEKIDKALLRRFDFVVNFDTYNENDMSEIFIESIRNKKILREISYNEKTYLSSGFLEKKYYKFVLENSNNIPFNVTSSIEKTEKYFLETGKLNLIYLFEKFLDFDSLEETVLSLKKNGFSQNEIYRILKYSFEFTAEEVREAFTNE